MLVFVQLLMIPEDDKTWSMLESSYSTLEFDYVPNTFQVKRFTRGFTIQSVYKGFTRGVTGSQMC